MDMIYKIIANKHRREIIKILKSGETTVKDLQQKLNIPQPLTSTHLSLLHKAGLVNFVQKGKLRYYTLNRDTLNVLYNSFYDFFFDGAGYLVRTRK